MSRSLRVGFFLALRNIHRSSIWTTSLIIFIMTLTFLNLVVVSGILVGLVEGIGVAYRGHYSGDVILSTLPRKDYMEKSADIVRFLKNVPDVIALTGRYLEAGRVEANYRGRIREPNEISESVGTLIVGIDPVAENDATQLDKIIVEGVTIAPEDDDKILLGSGLLYQFAPIDSPGQLTLKDVHVGSKVRIYVNDNVKEVTVAGIVKSKVDEIDRRVYMVDRIFRNMIGRTDYNLDEIVVRLKDGAKPEALKALLLANGFGETARVQTWEESQPKFFKDVKDTFNLLGTIIGSIGLIVASITIFIIIFVNAITRRKFIGILKGIGISAGAIEFSYIIQSLFYAIVGAAIGLVVLFGMLKPYFLAHPIDFPFSDGILVATPSGAAMRVFVLFVATTVAGYIPAKIVVRQNTLDAILGR